MKKRFTEEPGKWLEEQFLYLQTDNGPAFRSYAVQSWCIDYNKNRPQKELKRLTPNQFKTKLKSTKNSP